MFFKSSVAFLLSNCLNAKKYIWNTKYTIQHGIERLQTTKCIQYNIHDTKSCELPNEKNVYKCIGFLHENQQQAHNVVLLSNNTTIQQLD